MLEDPPTLTLLLLSGGMDSAALAAALRPNLSLFIDYGQRPAASESRAASAIAADLDLEFAQLDLDASGIGGGLLADSAARAGWPSPEWWPFRNQLLVTAAGAFGLRHFGMDTIVAHGLTLMTGTVASDGARHADGTGAFYDALSALLNIQEGNLSVAAPAISLSTTELIALSAISDSTLAWTHSCHTSDVPCSECPGCYKRAQVTEDIGRLL